MNGVYIRELEPSDFVQRSVSTVETALGRTLTANERWQFEQLAPEVQERVKSLSEVPQMVIFLYHIEYDEESWKKVLGHERAQEVLGAAVSTLTDVDVWEHDSIEAALRGMLEQVEIGARRGLQPIRVAVTGSSISPPLFESLAVLGKEETLHRLRDVRERL